MNVLLVCFLLVNTRSHSSFIVSNLKGVEEEAMSLIVTRPNNSVTYMYSFSRRCATDSDCYQNEKCHLSVGWCICVKCPSQTECDCDKGATTTQTNYQTYVFKASDIANIYTLGIGFGLPVISILFVISILVYCLRAKYSTSIQCEFMEENSSSNLVQTNLEQSSPPAYLDLNPPPIYDNIEKFPETDKLPSYKSLRKKNKSHSIS